MSPERQSHVVNGVQRGARKQRTVLVDYRAVGISVAVPDTPGCLLYILFPTLCYGDLYHNSVAGRSVRFGEGLESISDERQQSDDFV